jgi:hypothetical protein
MDNLDEITKAISAKTGVIITKDDPIIVSYFLVQSFIEGNNKVQIEHLNKLISNSKNVENAVQNLCKTMLLSHEQISELRNETKKKLNGIESILYSENQTRKESLHKKIRDIAIFGTLLFSAISLAVIVNFIHF